MKKQELQFELTGLKFDGVSKRPNFLQMSAICAYVNRPSDAIPSGGIDKPVTFDKQSVIKTVHTMIGQGINVSWPNDDLFIDSDKILSSHNKRFKIGSIDNVKVTENNEIFIEFHLWDYDFPDVCDFIKLSKQSIGCSVECLIGELIDKGDYYLAKDIDFTGNCLLFKDLAAFKTTYLAAQKKREVDRVNKEELQAMFAEFMASVNQSIDSVKAEVGTLASSVIEVKDNFAKFEAEKAEVEKLEKERMEAEAKAKEEEAKKARMEAEAKEAERLAEEEAKRKSFQFGIVKQYPEGTNEKQKAILSDASLNGSQQFQKLIALREQK